MFEILIYILKGIFQLLMWTWWIIVPIVAIMAFQNFRKAKWVENVESIVLGIKIPKNSEKGPTSAEMMFASLHGILKPAIELKKEGSIQEHISFEMVADAKSIMFYVWTPKHLQNFVEGQIYAQYPTAEISEVDDYSKDIDIDDDGENDCVASCELKLIKPDYFPIKTFVNFEVDPLAGITGALSKIEDHAEKMWIQILTRPVSDSWRDKGLAYAENLKNGTGGKLFTKAGIIQGAIQLPIFLLNSFFDILFPADDKGKGGGGDTKLPHNVETSLASLEEKANKLGYQVKIRLVYIAKSQDLARQHLCITTGAFKQFNTTLANGFTPTKIRTGQDVLDEYRARLFTDKGFVLNIEEVASLYHLPHASVETPNIVWTSSKKGEPPANLPYADDPSIEKGELTVFGETTFRGQLRKFGIKKDDRRRHMYILGKSGVGKSKILEILAVEDIKRGEGVGIVDPHGELIHDVLKQIPSHRINDVVYINPADKDFPIGFNPMKATPELREGVASGFVSVFKKQFGYSWGPRLEYLMRYAILALTYYPNTTMLDVVKILTDKDFRKKVLTYVEDPVVKTFWLKEFSTYNDKFATEAVAPILNKVGQFTASPTIRNIIGQTRETFDFEDAMNTQKIILVDLSAGKIGEDNSELLGSLMITKMQLAAMARARIKPEDRKDFFLYVDEFQNFATDAFAKILSEARKYRLSLVLANQYVAQMEEGVRDAVFGNVGTLISFRVGADDASYVEKQFSPVFEKDDLISLDNRHMYIKTLIDGEAALAFSAKSTFVSEGTEGNVEKIIALSREKYSRPREEIEEQIRKWSNVDSLDVDKAVDKQKDSKFDGDDYVRTARKQEFQKNKPMPIQKREVGNKINAPQANISQSTSGESIKLKKSVDPEELKKIIQKLTQPSSEKKDEELGATKNTDPSQPLKSSEVTKGRELPSSDLKAMADQDKNTRPDHTPKNPMTTVTRPTPETTEKIRDKLLKNDSSKEREEGEKEKTEIKITKIAGGVEVEKIKKQEPKTQAGIKITKITGGAEIERVKEQSPQAQPKQPVKDPIIASRPRIQPQIQKPISEGFKNKVASATDNKTSSPISRFSQPPKVMPKKFTDIEEGNTRELTREEFLDLKEILPNEKIIIVNNKKGGESTKENSLKGVTPNNPNVPNKNTGEAKNPTSLSNSKEKNIRDLKPGDTAYFNK